MGCVEAWGGGNAARSDGGRHLTYLRQVVGLHIIVQIFIELLFMTGR